MIFTSANVRLIQRGAKTQTRRRVRGDEPCRCQEGRTYAVQPGRGKSATCRLLVTGVRLEQLGDISFEDARREGFRTSEEFKATWVRIHDPWLTREIACLGCHCPQHGGLDGCLYCKGSDRISREEVTTIEEIVERFDSRWAEAFVWVITFELDTAHVPRYLAARPSPDYVTDEKQALPGEPEAVSEAEQARITERADTEFPQWQTLEQRTREEERARAGFEDRLRLVRQRAATHGVNVDRGVWMVEKMIAERRAPGAILNKLQGVERMLDQRRAA